MEVFWGFILRFLGDFLLDKVKKTKRSGAINMCFNGELESRDEFTFFDCLQFIDASRECDTIY